MRRSAFVRHSALMLTVLGTVVAVFAWPPLPQPSAYHLFADQRSFLSIPALFVGVGLTTLGSSYYHLAPDNARLVWDRLPMSVGFMGLLTALLAERISLPVSRWLFGPLLVVGAASVRHSSLKVSSSHRSCRRVSKCEAWVAL